MRKTFFFSCSGFSPTTYPQEVVSEIRRQDVSTQHHTTTLRFKGPSAEIRLVLLSCKQLTELRLKLNNFGLGSGPGFNVNPG
jgi:hypothetical protein